MFNRKFPYTDMHDLNLDWVMSKVKEMAAGVQNISSSISSVTAAYLQEHLPDMVEDEIDDLADSVTDQLDSVNASLTDHEDRIDDLETEVSSIQATYGSPLTANLASDMTDTTKVYVYTGSETGYVNGDWYYYNGTEWADGGVYNSVAISPNSITGSKISSAIRTALLNCFQHVAWADTDGGTYYSALESALYPPANLVSISAVYTQSGTVYDTDSLDDLEADLVVTALFDDETTSTVTDYTLSGSLEEGTSTITVTYGGKTTTFTVTVSAPSMYDVEYQGNLSTGSTDANRVTLVTTSLTFEANGGSHTISAQSGYLIYPFKELGASGDASSYNTAAGSNAIYVNARNNNDYIYTTSEIVVETNGAITVPTARTWGSSWTFTRESSASTIYTPIGFIIKKSDESAISIAEAIEAVTIS